MQSDSVQKRGWILAALMMTMALAAMDITIVSTAIPQIVGDLGGFNKFSWVFSIYLLAQTVTIPLYGKLTDLFGRKYILIFGIIIFLIGSGASAAAWNIMSLIAFRGLQGLGAGSIMATVNTIAGDIYKVEERAKVQGYLSSIWGISAIIGPALGGFLAEYVNWRWIFIINLPIGLMSIALLSVFFKEKVEVHQPKIDYKGALAILITLSLAFVFLLEGGQSWSWLSVESMVLFVLIWAFVWLAVRIEKKTIEPIMPAWLWRNRTLAFTNLSMVFMGIVMMGPETYLPTFTQSALGLGTIASGFILASMSLGWPVASSLSGKFFMRIGFRNTSIIGAFIVLLSCISFLLIPRPQPVYLLVVNQVLIGFGFGFLSTPTLVGIQSMVGWEQRGVVTGANVFSRNLGQSLGAAIMGAIFNNSMTEQLKKHTIVNIHNPDDMMKAVRNPDLNNGIRELLKEAINTSMHHIYWSLILLSICIALCLFVIPKKPHKVEVKA